MKSTQRTRTSGNEPRSGGSGGDNPGKGRQAPKELFALVVGYGGIAGTVYGVRENEADARRDLTGSNDYIVRYVRQQ